MEFRSPARAPRHLWTLPWAESHFKEELASIRADFPEDIVISPAFLKTPALEAGDPFAIGEYTDPWGCKFTNAVEGIIGEVREPLINDWDEDYKKVRFPEEWLTVDTDKVNQYCDSEDRFVISGVCARPFERLQFLRGTENLYMDLLDPPDGLVAFLGDLREFYQKLLMIWGKKTEVDALFFIDDWGSQENLLLSPSLWDELFRPFYDDFIQLAHSENKKAMMHSDGQIIGLYPRLIDMGLDAINSQLFCMDFEKLKAYAGRITFWGEIDRQHLLVRGTQEEVQEAVQQVYENLWADGGCIAQCEFGPGARPENVREVFAEWDKVAGQNCSSVV